MIEITDEQKLIYKGKICPYCLSEPVYVDSAEVYSGTSYGMIWLCRMCQSWVGTHKGTDKPLGRLANADLRHMKRMAHGSFDPLWKEKIIKRSYAYQIIGTALGIPKKFVHVGMFGLETCRKVIEICDKLKKEVVDMSQKQTSKCICGEVYDLRNLEQAVYHIHKFK